MYITLTVTLEQEDYPERDDIEIPSIRIIGESSLRCEAPEEREATEDPDDHEERCRSIKVTWYRDRC